MSAPFQMNRIGNVVVPSDAADQPQYSRIYCITAGNFAFTLIDPITGLESAVITIALTAAQTLDVLPKKIRTASTGTYLGLMTS